MSDHFAPRIIGIPTASIGEGTAVTLGTIVADPNVTYEYAWTVMWDGDTSHPSATAAEPDFVFTPNDDGQYLVSLTIGALGHATATVDQTLTVHNVAPMLDTGIPHVGPDMLDTSFGDGGLVTTDFQDSHNDVGRGLEIDSNGRIVVTGGTSTAAGGSDFAAVRYLSSGALDTDFGAGGIVTTDFGGRSYDQATGLAIDADNKIVVASYTGYSNQGGTGQDVAVVRYAATSGKQIVNEGQLYQLPVITITDPASNDPLHPDGPSTETFSAQIDWGDGTVEPGLVTIAIIEGSHNYADDGEYTVIVRVADDDMSADFLDGTAGVDFVEETIQIFVNNVAPTLAVVGEQVAEEGSVLSLVDIGTFTDPGFDNPDGPSGPTREWFSYQVFWGDGFSNGGLATIDTPGNAGVATAGSFDQSHTYTDRGVYTVTVVVADDNGGFDEQTFQVTVKKVSPTLVLDPVLPIDESGMVTLTGTITDPGMPNTFTLDVDWGDPLSPNNIESYTFAASPTGSQTFTQTHQYLDDHPSGTPSDSYTISATVSDDDGGRASGAGDILVATDYGDAPYDGAGPELDYPTLVADGGARHFLGGPRLGTLVDAESDGQPTTDADGDDASGLADEDGVTLLSTLVTDAATATAAGLSVTATGTDASTKLFGWIDFNQDGDWDDASEQVFAGIPVTEGDTILSLVIPAGAVAGDTYARFRISSDDGLVPTGPASDGEVEDYCVSLVAAGSPVSVQLPAGGGVYEIAAETGDVIVRTTSGSQLFRAPLAAVTSLEVVGSADDDTLTVALNVGANPVSAGGLTFTGGGSAGDHLALTGSESLSAVIHNYVAIGSGDITLLNGGSSVIHYAGIESIDDELTATVRDTVFLGGSEHVTLGDDNPDTPDRSTINSTAGTPTTFRNPQDDLRIETRNSADQIIVAGLDSAFAGPLILEAGPESGQVSFNGVLDYDGPLTVSFTRSIDVASGASINTHSGGMLLSAKRDIVMNGSARITTTSGPVHLSANPLPMTW